MRPKKSTTECLSPRKYGPFCSRCSKSANHLSFRASSASLPAMSSEKRSLKSNTYCFERIFASGVAPLRPSRSPRTSQMAGVCAIVRPSGKVSMGKAKPALGGTSAGSLTCAEGCARVPASPSGPRPNVPRCEPSQRWTSLTSCRVVPDSLRSRSFFDRRQVPHIKELSFARGRQLSWILTGSTVVSPSGRRDPRRTSYDAPASSRQRTMGPARP
mmetsp:Transcript_23882/g.94707  ORF Transcript_23882/g.94707 Transcript_23882/m.94707 type:complete len:215 (+) Transcript_23882:331-975(+)